MELPLTQTVSGESREEKIKISVWRALCLSDKEDVHGPGFQGRARAGDVDLLPWKNEKPLEVRGAKGLRRSKESASRRKLRVCGVQETR